MLGRDGDGDCGVIYRRGAVHATDRRAVVREEGRVLLRRGDGGGACSRREVVRREQPLPLRHFQPRR